MCHRVTGHKGLLRNPPQNFSLLRQNDPIKRQPTPRIPHFHFHFSLTVTLTAMTEEYYVITPEEKQPKLLAPLARNMTLKYVMKRSEPLRPQRMLDPDDERKIL